MMFTYTFNMKNAGIFIEDAIEKTLKDGYRTVDIMSDGFQLVSTERMTELVIENFREIYHTKKSVVLT